MCAQRAVSSRLILWVYMSYLQPWRTRAVIFSHIMEKMLCSKYSKRVASNASVCMGFSSTDSSKCPLFRIKFRMHWSDNWKVTKSSHSVQWCSYKVSKGAKIRNRYNQVPHLTQDTNGKVTNSQQTPQTRAKRSALSQQVTTKHI